jgi:hypothetical protein
MIPRKPCNLAFGHEAPSAPEQDTLLHPRLIDMIDPRHELVKLAVVIDRVDRQGGVRTEMGWVLSVPQRPARDGATAGGGAAVSAARLPAVG